jgi:anti-sigma factor (TIGR02949 family)
MIIDWVRRLFGGSPDHDHGSDSVSCEQSLRLLQDYMDGELDHLTASQVEAHFRVCKGCWPHLNFEERFRDRIRRASERDCCPDEVRAKVLAAIDQADD